MKRLALALAAILALGLAAACSTDAETANANLDKECGNFQCYRRVIFENAITGKYEMAIEGWCDVDFSDPNKQRVTCKVGTDKDGNAIVRRNGMSKADNVFGWYTQLDTTSVSTSRYQVILKPEAIVPEPEIR